MLTPTEDAVDRNPYEMVLDETGKMTMFWVGVGTSPYKIYMTTSTAGGAMSTPVDTGFSTTGKIAQYAAVLRPNGGAGEVVLAVEVIEVDPNTGLDASRIYIGSNKTGSMTFAPVTPFWPGGGLNENEGAITFVAAANGALAFLAKTPATGGHIYGGHLPAESAATVASSWQSSKMSSESGSFSTRSLVIDDAGNASIAWTESGANRVFVSRNTGNGPWSPGIGVNASGYHAGKLIVDRVSGALLIMTGDNTDSNVQFAEFK